MTTDNPDPLEVWREACGKYEDACEAGDTLRDGVILGDQAAAAIIAQHYAPLVAENARLRVESYKTFTDGMEAAAEICSSLAETTYDDTEAFEAATGCEAEIMKVVKQQRKEQAGAKP